MRYPCHDGISTENERMSYKSIHSEDSFIAAYMNTKYNVMVQYLYLLALDINLIYSK